MNINIGDPLRKVLSVSGKDLRQDERGFTLLELMIVVVIVGILATQIVTGWRSSVPKVKNAAFSMRGDFNYARGEAAKRNENVLIDFFVKGEPMNDAPPAAPVNMSNDGYRICLDNNGDSGSQATIPPPLPDSWNGTSVSFGSNRFEMKPDGTSNKGGIVYLYVPNQEVLSTLPIPASGTPDPADVIDAPPFAVVVSFIGRVRLVRWRNDIPGWSRK